MMLSREDKAKAFVDHAKLFALGSWEPITKRKPHLWDAISERGRANLTFEQKCFKWDFLFMVAMIWWAANIARLELSEAELESVGEILEQHMADWSVGTVPAFADLNRFICKYDAEYKNIREVQKAVEFTKLLVGTWLLWNLTNKAQLDDEAELATMLGGLAHVSVAGYWRE